MQTFASAASARRALAAQGYALVATVPGKDSTRYGYSRRVNGAVQSAVLVSYTHVATVRYL